MPDTFDFLLSHDCQLPSFFLLQGGWIEGVSENPSVDRLMYGTLSVRQEPYDLAYMKTEAERQSQLFAYFYAIAMKEGFCAW